MGLTERIWAALSAMIRLEDSVKRQAEAMQSQQQRLEDLTARVIRIEAHLELYRTMGLAKRLPRD